MTWETNPRTVLACSVVSPSASASPVSHPRAHRAGAVLCERCEIPESSFGPDARLRSCPGSVADRFTRALERTMSWHRLGLRVRLLGGVLITRPADSPCRTFFGLA